VDRHPLSSVRIYDNSIAMIDVSEEGVTEVSVLKGDVDAKAGPERPGSSPAMLRSTANRAQTWRRSADPTTGNAGT
jgi:hypothetical protein